jgi:phosphoribosylanthranilate isomerase
VSSENPQRYRVRVKICGITNAADAIAAIEAGADALGFNLFPGSKRFVDLNPARGWISELPQPVRKVAILVNPTLEAAAHLAGSGVVDALQLHGQETPAFCEALQRRGVSFSKAIPVLNDISLADVPSFFTPMIVLDSARGGQFGGSGHAFPWALARRFCESHPELRIVLAGGLTPANVAEAVRLVRPFGVDVTTGVEAAAGRKDHGLLRGFVQAAKG